ncbi:MAG: efflux RND transporter periplasmic adaptor subunit [Candidatus Margulisbacteria bacterium]|nr:efflux RND transporter periplasmic adaptor subunit [Candidatus Margulisiibacteriota bacterium]
MFKNLLKNKKLVIGLVIVLVIVIGIVIIRTRSGGVEIKVGKVSRGNILSMVSASGLVRANSVKLGTAMAAGRVDWVGVEEGSRVYRGQTLLKLDGFNQAEKEHKRLQQLHDQGFVSDLELERAKTVMDNARVVAPFSGIVAEKAVIPGEAISMGVPVLTVVDIDNPWVEIQVDEVDVGVVKVGQRVRFTTDAFPDQEFFGQITWLNKKAELKKVGGRVRFDEEDQVFRGKVKFEDGSDLLRPGMTVYAEIITGEKKDVVVAPREAITLRSGKRIAFVIKNDRARSVEVELGLKDAEKVEILKGLSVGQTVAVSNLDNIKEKSKVKIVKNNNE